MIASNPTKLKREYIGGRYRIVPRFNIEPCNLYGDNWYIVRLNGRIVTTIAAQETRAQARKRAVAWWQGQRKPVDTSIPCPF